jgi:hypothetical protein
MLIILILALLLIQTLAAEAVTVEITSGTLLGQGTGSLTGTVDLHGYDSFTQSPVALVGLVPTSDLEFLLLDCLTCRFGVTFNSFWSVGCCFTDVTLTWQGTDIHYGVSSSLSGGMVGPDITLPSQPGTYDYALPFLVSISIATTVPPLLGQDVTLVGQGVEYLSFTCVDTPIGPPAIRDEHYDYSRGGCINTSRVYAVGASVPEPATWLLMVAGVVALIAARRHARRG